MERGQGIVLMIQFEISKPPPTTGMLTIAEGKKTQTNKQNQKTNPKQNKRNTFGKWSFLALVGGLPCWAATSSLFSRAHRSHTGHTP